MTTIYIDGHRCHYEVQALCGLFLGGEELRVLQGRPDGADGRYVYTGHSEEGGRVVLTAEVRRDGQTLRRQTEADPAALPPGERALQLHSERAFGRMLYEMLSVLTGVTPPWGILTGVRPVSLALRVLESGGDEEQARQFLRQEQLVSEEKTALALETARVQRPFLTQRGADTASLYVSIPFCPSRCRYCSFVSHSIAGARELVEPYLELLRGEVALLGEKAARHGVTVDCIYIGGGTPTSLDAGQLEALLSAVARAFPLERVQEYTVEAGRPDTITPEKLGVLRRMGVGRVSVNPQSLRDEVLRLAGRPHTAAQAVEAFALARRAGFATINMDLIAGLEGDTPETFFETLRQVIALRPENVTVHTLSIKRSASLQRERAGVLARGGAERMVRGAATALRAAGYRPYYLYRQKNTVDNLENTGWSLPGHENRYNIRIMDERFTILAAGAGAVVKLAPPGGQISRIFHYKYPYEYISRFGTLRERLDGIDRFYEACKAPSGVL